MVDAITLQEFSQSLETIEDITDFAYAAHNAYKVGGEAALHVPQETVYTDSDPSLSTGLSNVFGKMPIRSESRPGNAERGGRPRTVSA